LGEDENKTKNKDVLKGRFYVRFLGPSIREVTRTAGERRNSMSFSRKKTWLNL
jgi:hypothetical protein